MLLTLGALLMFLPLFFSVAFHGRLPHVFALFREGSGCRGPVSILVFPTLGVGNVSRECLPCSAAVYSSGRCSGTVDGAPTGHGRTRPSGGAPPESGTGSDVTGIVHLLCVLTAF